MDTSGAVSAFGALSQETRLNVVRLLLQSGEQGLLAGEIAQSLNVRQNTMSANLSVLLNAGLVRKERQGRGIRYFADFSGLRGLISFLMADCCGGAPQICQPILDAMICTPGTGPQDQS